MWWLPLVVVLILAVSILPFFFKNYFKNHSLAIGGSLLYLFSFFLLPWVTLNLDCVLDVVNQKIVPILSLLGISADTIINLFGSEELQSLHQSGTVLGHYAFNPSGALLTVYYPISKINLFFWMVLWVPAIYAFFVLFTSSITLVPIMYRLQKVFGTIISLVGFIAIFPLLVIGLPLIARWGAAGEFIPGLVALIFNVRLGYGAWLALLVAVPMMVIGGERLYSEADNRLKELGFEQSSEGNPFLTAVLGVPAKVWVLLGAVTFLAAFFFLPWVTYDRADYQVNLSEINKLSEMISEPLCFLQGKSGDCVIYDPQLSFNKYDIHGIEEKITQGGTITGLSLAMHPFRTNLVMVISLIGLVSLTVVQLVWGIIFLTQNENSADVPMDRGITAFSTFITCAFGLALLFYYPYMDFIGTTNFFQLSLLMVTAQAQVGYGAVVGLVAVSLMCFGGFIGILQFWGDETIRITIASIVTGISVALLLLVLGIVLQPSPCNVDLSGTPVEIPTETPILVPDTVTPSPVVPEWLTYSNPSWGISLSYPSYIVNRPINLVEENLQIPEGAEQILLLSDSAQASSQQLAPDETLRVLVFRVPAEGVSFDEWVTQMSSYVGDGVLTPSMLGTCNRLFIQAETPVSPYQWSEGIWVEGQGYYYGIISQGLGIFPAEVKTLMESFNAEGCVQ